MKTRIFALLSARLFACPAMLTTATQTDQMAAQADPLFKDLRALPAAARQKAVLRESIEPLGEQMRTADRMA